jgi:hypothetical protein
VGGSFIGCGVNADVRQVGVEVAGTFVPDTCRADDEQAQCPAFGPVMQDGTVALPEGLVRPVRTPFSREVDVLARPSVVGARQGSRGDEQHHVVGLA